MAAGAGSVFDAVPAGGWEQIAGTVDAIDRAWLAVRKDPVPPLLDNRMDSALDALGTADPLMNAARTR